MPPAFGVDLAAFSVHLAAFSVDLAAFSVDEFSGRAFLCVAVRAELSRIFWQGVPVGRCKGGAITNFLAECSCGSL